MPAVLSAHRARRAAALTLSLGLALSAAEGCSSSPGPVPPPSGPANVRVSGAPTPGGALTLSASGFAPDAPVEIGFGPPESEYEVISRGRTDRNGALNRTLSVPDWAESGRRYVIVVTEPDHDPRAVSDPFVVTEAGASPMRIEGRLTEEGVECPALRGSDGSLYALASRDLGGYAPGDEVVVFGRLAEVSFCMQGTTLAVDSIRGA